MNMWTKKRTGKFDDFLASVTSVFVLTVLVGACFVLNIIAGYISLAIAIILIVTYVVLSSSLSAQDKREIEKEEKRATEEVEN